MCIIFTDNFLCFWSLVVFIWTKSVTVSFSFNFHMLYLLYTVASFKSIKPRENPISINTKLSLFELYKIHQLINIHKFSFSVTLWSLTGLTFLLILTFYFHQSHYLAITASHLHYSYSIICYDANKDSHAIYTVINFYLLLWHCYILLTDCLPACW